MTIALAGKVALVMGSARSLGAAIAKRPARDGQPLLSPPPVRPEKPLSTQTRTQH